MQLRPYQRDLANNTWRSLRKHRAVMVQSTTGSGKCLGKDTPVLMSDGRILPVQDVKVGDCLMGDDGTVRNVLSVCSGEEMLYRVTPVKGDSWVCNESHILSLISTAKSSKFVKNSIYDFDIKSYDELGKTEKHLLKQYRVAVPEFLSEKRDLIIEPYFLGVLIGDGSLQNTIRITTPDPEIVQEIERQGKLWGVNVRYEPMENNKSSNYYFVTPKSESNGCKGGSNPLLNAVKSLNLRVHCKDKFIPFHYKTHTYFNRLEILAGLLDTDGHYQDGFEYSSKSKHLAEDIAFISRSVGLAAYISLKIVKGETYYRVSISGDLDKIPTRITRKQAPARQQIKSVLRTGFSITPLENGEYYGFEIDGNKRFLLGDFTVTHNTVVIVKLTNKFCENGDDRTLILAHREELITQTGNKLRDAGLDVGFIQADRMPDYSLPVQVASIQTLIRRKLPKNIKYVITDEVHHCTAASYRKIYELLPEAKLLGFTATPIRTNGQGFDDIYDDLVVGPQPKELIDMGYLLQPKYYVAPLRADLSSVKKTAGDYNEKALAAVMDKQSLTGDVVREWHERAYGKKTITFAVNIEHSKHIVERYMQSGIGAAHIDGNTPKEVRRRLFAEFKRGDFHILSNVGIATEGTDIPEVECVQSVRPTQSLSLWLQMGGRGLRPFGDQEHCIVLDHSNNIFAHGFLEQEREWTLKGIKKNSRPEGDKKVMVAYQGRMYFPQDLPDEAVEIKLIEMDYSATRMNDLNRFIAEADRRGRKRYSAYYEFMKRYKPTPIELITFQEKLGVKKGWAYHAMKDLGYSNEIIKEISSVIYS